MKIFFIAILIIFIAIFQSSFLAEFSIFGNTLNIIFAIGIAIAILKWDEAAPIWVGFGALILDFINSTPFGLYIISFGLTFFVIRFISARISLVLEQKYLIFAWSALASFLCFIISFLYLYLLYLLLYKFVYLLSMFSQFWNISNNSKIFKKQVEL